MIRLSITCQILTILLIFAGSAVNARDLWVNDEEDSSLKLNSTFNGLGLASAPSVDRTSEEHGASGSLFGELHIEVIYRMKTEIEWDAAYDNRLTWSSGSSIGISSALQPNSAGSYRIRQISGAIARSENFIDYHELDRASFAYQPKWMNLVIGRQAVGWGRGTLFSAVDIFAPFTPLEINREWRRGVDALRADIKITSATSVDLVSAWGPSWDESALGVRAPAILVPLMRSF